LEKIAVKRMAIFLNFEVQRWIERSALDAKEAAKPQIFKIARASFAKATARQGSARSTL
jgi:hypothetical protein